VWEGVVSGSWAVQIGHSRIDIIRVPFGGSSVAEFCRRRRRGASECRRRFAKGHLDVDFQLDMLLFRRCHGKAELFKVTNNSVVFECPHRARLIRTSFFVQPTCSKAHCSSNEQTEPSIDFHIHMYRSESMIHRNQHRSPIQTTRGEREVTTHLASRLSTPLVIKTPQAGAR
jgi:hypothetical protein